MCVFMFRYADQNIRYSVVTKTPRRHTKPETANQIIHELRTTVSYNRQSYRHDTSFSQVKQPVLRKVSV